MPNVMSDGVVLQARAAAAVWGHAEPGREVVVTPSWDEPPSTVVADSDGNWRVRVLTPGPGGPHSIVVHAGDESLTIRDVLCGEVWIAGGQSNMEMALAPGHDSFLGAIGWERELEREPDDGLRFFRVANTIALDEASDVEGRWERAAPDTIGAWSACAYFHARALRERLGVPVGVVAADWSGTPAEAWTPADVVERFERPRRARASLNEAARDDDVEAINREAIRAWWDVVDATDEGVKGGSASAAFDDSAWSVVDLPGVWEDDALDGFDGVVWYRRRVTVPASWVGQDLSLELGPIDDEDVTYVNGVVVGDSRAPGLWNTPRRYLLPARLVQQRELTISVRVLDTGGGGGLHGSPDQLKLSRSETESMSLAGPWRWRVGARLGDLPARRLIDQHMPSVLFDGMIAPIAPFTARGFIWYQGESNRAHAEEYASLFPAMIGSWRERFEAPEAPFLFVQIAPYTYDEDRGEAAALRESQRATLGVPDTRMVVTADVGDPDDIHPRRKKEVGERLALAALELAYGIESDEALSPVPGLVERDGDAVVIRFDRARSGLVADGHAVAGLEAEIAPGRWTLARAEIKGDRLRVTSMEGGRVERVRYLWDDAPIATLFNRRGLPVSPFLVGPE
ncbi:MAG: sialate O-acetylesterase [Planctomycetota bacterium]